MPQSHPTLLIACAVGVLSVVAPSVAQDLYAPRTDWSSFTGGDLNISGFVFRDVNRNGIYDGDDRRWVAHQTAGAEAPRGWRVRAVARSISRGGIRSALARHEGARGTVKITRCAAGISQRECNDGIFEV